MIIVNYVVVTEIVKKERYPITWSIAGFHLFFFTNQMGILLFCFTMLNRTRILSYQISTPVEYKHNLPAFHLYL